MSSVVIAGDTSGSVTLQAPAVSGSTVLTLPATSGTVLTSASTISGTQGASMVLIGSATASASATIDFTSISNTSYSAYRMIIINMIPTTNAVNLLLRFSNGGTFATTSYTWQNWRWTTAGSAVVGQGGTGTGIALNAANADNMANTATHGGSWVIDIYDCAQTTAYHRVNYQGNYLGSAQLGVVGNGISPSTTAIDGFRLLMDSGTIASGTVYLYGVKNA